MMQLPSPNQLFNCAIVICFVLTPATTRGQIVPDSTLRVNSTITTSDSSFVIQGGTQSGSNLLAWIWLVFGLGLLLVATVVPVAQIATADTRGYTQIQQNIRVHLRPSAVQNPKSLLDEGRTLFASGRFLAAARVWEAAAVGFQRQGDAINQAWSLSYLSLAYQNLGEWEKAKTEIANSLDLLKNKGNTAILAVAFNTQGSLNITMGQAEAALNSWQEAERAYAAVGDDAGKVGSKINQAQALTAMGLYRRARSLLVSVNEQLQSQPDSLIKVKGLQSLGVVLQVVGDLQQSQEVLKQGLAISERLGSNVEQSEILFSLGNTLRDLQQDEAALLYYQQARALASNSDVQVEALLNQLSLYIETSQPQQAIALIPQIESQLENLPPSRMSVYAQVNFARSLSILEPPEDRLPCTHKSK